MLCQVCGERQAVFHRKININGVQKEEHLCAQCAAGEDKTPWFDSIFSGFLDVPEKRRALSCPVCGMTAQDISHEGKAGCANCYKVFSSLLMPYIQKIHGATQHTGAVPESAGAELKKRRRLSELRERLNEAISSQEFERAASLRDEIKELESE